MSDELANYRAQDREIDDYHDNYSNAPSDGSAWIESSRTDTSQLLRGGSWSNFPQNCRSADRHNDLCSVCYYHYRFSGMLRAARHDRPYPTKVKRVAADLNVNF